MAALFALQLASSTLPSAAILYYLGAVGTG
jgi:hypothetical protein